MLKYELSSDVDVKINCKCELQSNIQTKDSIDNPILCGGHAREM